MSYDPTKSLGERLCDAFQETFSGGGWAEPLTWGDFDASGQARYERAAVAFVAKLSDALSTPSEQQEGEIRGDYPTNLSPASRSPRQHDDGEET